MLVVWRLKGDILHKCILEIPPLLSPSFWRLFYLFYIQVLKTELKDTNAAINRSLLSADLGL